jgi:CRP-like cAMP-binding protein
MSLPLLTHSQMLQITKKARRLTFEPGAIILERDQHVSDFFMITRGSVDIVLEGRKHSNTVIAQMNPGEFFGEIELLRGGKSIASVRAAPGSPVELLALERNEFLPLIKESPLTEEALGHIIQHRLAENRAASSNR